MVDLTYMAYPKGKPSSKRSVVNKGERFGRLVLTGASDIWRHHTRVEATCECGSGITRFYFLHALKRGSTSSCGCVQKERASASSKTHGCEPIRLFRIWSHLKRRCLNPSNPAYRNYGGRGITVCDEWSTSFEAFRDWALANGYLPSLQIDRRNNESGYSPENCRWSTSSEQQRNTRRNPMYSAFGESKTLADWVEDRRCVVGYQCIWSRLKRGMDIETALTLAWRDPKANLRPGARAFVAVFGGKE